MNSYVKYLYVMKLLDGTDPPLYKVGYCSLDKKRLGEYTMLPYEVEYVFVYECANTQVLEWKIHCMFEKKRVRGEWFRLNKQDVENIINFASCEVSGKEICKDLFLNLNAASVKRNCIIPVNSKDYSEIADGCESKYVISYKHGVYTEQDLGVLPYIKVDFARAKEMFGNAVTKGMFIYGLSNGIRKYYPNINLTDFAMSLHYHTYAVFRPCGNGEDFQVKVFGENKQECIKIAMEKIGYSFGKEAVQKCRETLTAQIQ